jgi:hypothetical protein
MKLRDVLLITLALVAKTALAHDEFEVAISGESAETLRLSYSTKEEFFETCPMIASRLELWLPGTADGIGLVAFQAIRDVTEPCDDAEGPMIGTLELRKGPDLPSLPKGKYKLLINGHPSGVLEMRSSGSGIVPAP